MGAKIPFTAMGLLVKANKTKTRADLMELKNRHGRLLGKPSYVI